ncbi:MAG: TIM barrel protein [Vicinamibacterales bacterium]|nr:TIM barrel protein [Vicinamibacterales bacterium]
MPSSRLDAAPRGALAVGIDQYGLGPLGLSPQALLRWAIDHGADGVQFSGLEPEWRARIDAAYLDDLRALAEGARLYLEWGGAGHIPRDMTTWAHRDLFDENRTVAVEAARLGARVVRSCSGGLMRWDAAAPQTEILLRDTARALRAQREMLRDHGVVLAIELHFEFTTHELLRLFEMCEAEPDDWVGVVLDTMNVLTMLEDPLRATDRILPWVVATHVKDGGLRVAGDDLETFPTAVGEGVVDLPAVVGRVAASGRAIHLSVEDHGGVLRLPVGEPRFLAEFPDLTADERAALEMVARQAERAGCVATDRDRWPEVCEARMIRDLAALRAIVAGVEAA